jgi:hypothetical protein
VDRYDGEKRYALPQNILGCSSWVTAKHLEPLKGGKIPLEVLVRGKDAEGNEKLFQKIASQMKSAGVSHFLKMGLGEKTDVW